MHKIIETSLATALATTGTLAVAYPTGTTKGDFIFGAKHKIVALQYEWIAPRDFTITLGDTTFTITWKATATLPAGTDLIIQLDMPGTMPAVEEGPKKRALAGAVSLMALALVSLGTPAVADPNGICESQSVSADTDAEFDGVLASDDASYAELDVPRNVVASWTNAAVLTITGEDKYGNTMVEKSASGTSHTGKKAFYKITSVQFSANVTGATVGTGDVLGLPMFLPSKLNIIHELKDGSLLPRKAGKFYLQGLQTEANVDAGTSLNFVSPVSGRIAKVWSMAQGGITTGGAITVEINTVAVNGLSVTVADSAAEGDVDSDTPTAGHASAVVAVGDRVEIVFAAGFNASADMMIVVEIDLDEDDVFDGTIVVGSTAAPSATSDDVRGTYAPSTVPDGSASYGLVVALADPGHLGGPQYAG